MEYVVLAAWIVQAGVGVALFVGWLRHGRGSHAPTVLTHVGLSLAGLGLWVWFVLGGGLWPAWLALVAITAGNVLGDAMMVRRSRRATGVTTTFWKGYGAAIGQVFRGVMPPHVTFHALFAGVVYFTCLGVCIGATVAATG